jgi:hypothetical protein
MTLGDLGLGMRWTWHETNGMDMGWKPALRSESAFFSCLFGSMHIGRTVFLLHILYGQHALMSCMNLFLL